MRASRETGGSFSSLPGVLAAIVVAFKLFILLLLLKEFSPAVLSSSSKDHETHGEYVITYHIYWNMLSYLLECGIIFIGICCHSYLLEYIIIHIKIYYLIY